MHTHTHTRTQSLWGSFNRGAEEMTTPVIIVCVYHSFLLLFPPFSLLPWLLNTKLRLKSVSKRAYMYTYTLTMCFGYCVSKHHRWFSSSSISIFTLLSVFSPISPLSPHHPLVLDYLQIDYSVVCALIFHFSSTQPYLACRGRWRHSCFFLFFCPLTLWHEQKFGSDLTFHSPSSVPHFSFIFFLLFFFFCSWSWVCWWEL